MSDNKGVTDGAKNSQNADRTGDMLDLPIVSTPEINLENLVKNLTFEQREQILQGVDLMSFAKIFEDENMMITANTFIGSGMNVCAAAQKLYMHRNTLMYRLKLIKKRTGLDLHDFDMAVTFKILHCLYSGKQGI